MAWTKIAKSSASWIKLALAANFLLKEDGAFLLKEDYGRIIISSGITWTKVAKPS